MAESGKDEKTLNVFERVKDEMGAVIQSDKHHNKETHGLNYDIDENTSMSDVRAPNVFERAKEEFEALVEAIHPKKRPMSQHLPLNDETRHRHTDDDSKNHVIELRSGKDEKTLDVFEKVKEEMGAIFQSDKHHHKETHGLNYDIDENTSMSDVRAPNVLERAKEEFEALVEAIHPKKRPISQHLPLNDETRHCHADDSKNQVIELSSEKTKEDIESLKQEEKSAPHHHKETHGRSDDIDENTPISEVKGPSVFERAKEEIEALFQTINPKKDTGNDVSSPKK